MEFQYTNEWTVIIINMMSKIILIAYIMAICVTMVTCNHWNEHWNKYSQDERQWIMIMFCSDCEFIKGDLD
ncbi:unnamed protein product, partial [Oppiella nova]